MGNGNFEVKRFYCGIHQDGFVGLIPDEIGGVVMYEDYAKLEAQVKQMAAENAYLKTPLLHWDVEKLEMEYGTLPETPATDAYLSQLRNEARAEGVEMFAVDQNKKYEEWLRAGKVASNGDSYHACVSSYAEDFATELREGKAGEVQS